MSRNTLDYAVSKRLRQALKRVDLNLGQQKFFDNCLKEIEKLELEALDKADLEQSLRATHDEYAELREALRKFLGVS